MEPANFDHAQEAFAFVELLDEARMRALTVHAFGVLLRSGLPLLSLSHAW